MKLSVNSQNEANLHYIHEKLDYNFFILRNNKLSVSHASS